MPLDPSISLNVRPPQFQAPDPIQTLVTVAQLRNMQSQEQLRNLQMADLSSKLQTYGAMQDPNGPLAQLAAMRGGGGGMPGQPGMVPGTQLGQAQMPTPAALANAGIEPGTSAMVNVPPGGMGQPMPQVQPLASGVPAGGYLGPQDLGNGQVATVLNHTVTEPSINGGRATNIPLIVPGISRDEIQAIARGDRPSDTAYQRSIAHAQQRLAAGETIPSYGSIDEAVTAAKAESQQRGTLLQPPASRPDAGAAGPPPAPNQGAGPSQLPTTPGGDDSTRIANLYRQMYAKYRPDIVEPLINSYMNIDKNLLEQQKGKLEFQKAGLNVVEQGMATVLEQPNPAEAYAQVRQMWIERGIPGAQQMPPQFNPQWAQTMATNARTAKERIDQQLTAWERQNTQYDTETRRLAEDREGRKVTVEHTQGGNLLQQLSPLPGTTGTMPQPGVGGGVAMSTEAVKNAQEAQRVAITPTAQGYQITKQVGGQTSPMTVGGQPALPSEYGKQQTLYDPQGNAYVLPENVPPGRRPMAQQPGMVPSGYSTPPGTPAGAAPGATGGPPALMNQEGVQKNLQVGRDVQKQQLDAASTQAEQARNSLDTLDQMKALMHQGYYDDLLAKNMATPEAMKALIAAGKDPQLLANTYKIQNLANQLVIAEQGGRGLRVGPTEIGKLTGAAGQLEQIPPKAASLQMVEELRQKAKKDLSHYNELAGAQSTKLYQYPVKDTVSAAEFNRRYSALRASNPKLTTDQLALAYEQAGVHVEGAY